MDSNRSAAVFAMIGVVVLAVLYGASIVRVSGLTQEKNNLQIAVESLENQTYVLQNTANNLTGQVNRLNKELADLEEPKLVALQLDLKCNENADQIRLLRITGYVINVGSGTARNCTIHVLLYQDQTFLREIDIPLLEIGGGTYVAVDQSINSGDTTLTNWKMDLGWTT